MSKKEMPPNPDQRNEGILNNNMGSSDIYNIPETLPGCFGEYNNQYFGKCIDCSVHLPCARTSARDD